MRRSFSIWLFIIAGVLSITAPNLTAEEQFLQVVPLPINEVETILANWLSQAGFAVERMDTPLATRRLSGNLTNQTWQIDLKPHSALATEIDARFRAGEAQVEKRAMEGLEDYLAGYMQKTAPLLSDSGKVVPGTVSTHIPSVVCLGTINGEKSTQYTGFILAPDGLIMCTTHGLKGSEKVRVVLYNGRILEGRPIKIDPEKDLALIQASSRLESSITLASGRNLLDMGEGVYSIGCPVNLIGTVYPGVATTPARRAGSMAYWQVSMEIHPGSSGSPVFDAMGNIVGVIKGRYRGTNSIAFVIPLETIVEFLK
jgi:serine protease Do